MASTGPRVISAVVLAVLAAAAGLVLALIVTPPVTVTVFGQDLRLGAVSPLEIRGVSGPGQADLFGEGPVQTALQFDGPIRPRIVWQRFDRNRAAADFIQTSDVSGPSFRTDLLGSALAAGWTAYFLRLIAMSAVLAGAVRLALLGAARVLRGSLLRPASRRAGVLSVVGAMVLAALVTATAAGVTMASARDQLASVRTLADITGTAPLVPTPEPVGPARGDIELAVIGDSTAAGVGNDPLADPAGYDETCGRSQDAYAVVLGSALRVPTLNLACSSATLEAGLLGPQVEGDVTIPPQVGVLKSITSLRAVVVSIGANDIGWADFLRLCYGLERCDDQASERLFESRLDTFRIRYAQLLQQLSDLPSHPAVFVVLYYDPFGDTFDCPALRDPNAPAQPPVGYGFAADPGEDNQDEKIRTKIDPLRSELTQMNTVLEEGATAFGYAAVSPSFAGHALCTAQPWVQGMSERYPFHPNAAGELAIAAALLPSLAGVLATSG
ncbi:MAG: GDSL-type esterase/lipase family protein [Candidatus Nanopelagicales bacterium]